MAPRTQIPVRNPLSTETRRSTTESGTGVCTKRERVFPSRTLSASERDQLSLRNFVLTAAADGRVSLFVCEVIVRKGDRTDMTEYASRRTGEVMNERFPQSHGHLSLIGIRSKIDQEFPILQRSL
ncbi:MAG: hypothetical protein ACI93T_000812 [Porticoccaceae bacterium]|jgi:hypothetical protein